MTSGKRIVLAVVLAGAAIAAALLTNFVLLDLSTERDDPVGRLRPVFATTGSSTPGGSVQTGQDRPVETESEGSHAESDGMDATESDDDQDD